LKSALEGCPAWDGAPIEIRFRRVLFAHRGKLLFREGRGTAVHAASFIRRRLIVLEAELLDSSAELRRILLHELAHFAWVRLGNPARNAWSDLLREEWDLAVKGEMGWSSESRKLDLRKGHERRWREYVCESFCDTAAWIWAGEPAGGEVTLGARARKGRKQTFLQLIGSGNVKI
jgi:hypothetical protein